MKLMFKPQKSRPKSPILGFFNPLHPLLWASVVASCSPEHQEPVKKPPETKQGWESALKATYVARNLKPDGDGRTAFMACMDGSLYPCTHLYFGNADIFNKATDFTPAASKLNFEFTEIAVGVNILVPDCNGAAIQFMPKYASKGGWLFMDKMAVSADDKLILERSAQLGSVSRDVESYGVTEIFGFLLTPQDIAALRAVTPESRLSVRLSGSRGYVSLPLESVKALQASIVDALYAYDHLQAGLAAHLPATCS
jgi:hypothetical protein